MKCQVCKTECNNLSICPECRFDQLDTVFVNKDDAEVWIQNVVIPFREEYWLRKLPQFSITDGVLEKYTGKDTQVKVPYGVTSIGQSAFSSNIFLERIVLPSTVKEIQKEAFSCCENLVEVNLNEGLKSIHYSAFECCDLLSMTLPDSISHLDEGFCLGGAVISLKESNTHYEVIDECLIDRRSGTLLHCWSDEHKIYVPQGVKRVGKWAFPLIENERRRVRLPEGVESIGFVGRGVYALFIPSSVETIDDGSLYEVTRLHINSNNKRFYCQGGCIIDKQTNTIIAVENRVRLTYHIPQTISSIARYAFYGCKNMRKLVVPGSVNHIGYWAFALCDNLEGIYLEHDAEGSSWDAWWNYSLKVKCYWKDEWHYEPMPNN